MRGLKRRWLLIPVAVVAALSRPCSSRRRRRPRRPSASTIKIAVLSDCQGAFGAFDNQDLAGVVAAMSRVRRREAGRPEQPAQGLDGRLDRRSSAQARRDRLRQRPCRHGDQGDEAPDGAARRRRDDRPALRRRVDRGRELREAASDEDVRRRLRGRAGHDAEGAGAELLPLQRRRRAVERRSRRPRLQQAGLEDGGSRRGRLQLRVDVGRRLHRRVLRGRRQRHASGSSRR